MSSRRGWTTATLLTNGTVLVAGGDDGYGDLDTTETYDPVSRNWSSAGTMNERREDHLAVLLLDGRVLEAGPGFSAELYVPTLLPNQP